jgi:cytochrome P450
LTLPLVFHNLARDPARYKKLRDIILADFGTYDQPTEITFSKLKDCKYLRYVNDESLRLYPVVPLNARYANKDTTLPRGGGKDGNSPIFVPKGSTCDFSVHVMHRRKDIWGPDADEFKPERWEGRKVGWEYLPVSYMTAYPTHTHTPSPPFFFSLPSSHWLAY